MPPFNNAAIATSFKTSTNPNPKDTNNLGNNKKNQNGIRISKTKLVKQDMLTGMTVLHLVFLMTNDKHRPRRHYHRASSQNDTGHSGKPRRGPGTYWQTGVDGILAKQDNHCTLLSNIRT
jgi:hypothetical protein